MGGENYSADIRKLCYLIPAIILPYVGHRNTECDLECFTEIHKLLCKIILSGTLYIVQCYIMKSNTQWELIHNAN